MKTEFIEILKIGRERVATGKCSYICISILDQIDKNILENKSSYYEYALYGILAEQYFTDRTLIQILEYFVPSIHSFVRKEVRVMWIDFLIGHILNIPNGVETEKSILDAAGKATQSLIYYIENGGLEE